MQVDTQLTAPLGAVAAETERLQAAGFDGVFTFEGPNDVFFPLVEAAPSGLDIYTNVAISFPRSPVHLAHQAWDLQRLSQGRFALGLGTQVRRHIEQRFSATWGSPAAHMREQILAIKAIFGAWQHGEALTFEGEYYRHTYMPPLFSPPPLDGEPPPVWCGAVGPRLTRVVAEVADGLLVHPFHSDRSLHETTMPLVDEGLAASERTRDSFTFVVDAIVCAGRDDAELAAADAGCRSLLAFYGSTPAYRAVLDLHGWGELQPVLQQMVREGRWGELADRIGEPLLDTLCLRGSPDDVAAELVRRYGAVADRVGFYLPYGHDPALTTEIIDAIRLRTAGGPADHRNENRF
jgi:probable F420-dependent oxidoreductase